MENHNENQDMNTQPADASYYLDPYYNLDPYEKNPYCDHAPYPKSVPRKEPIRMLGQSTTTVYPNGVSYEEYEARKRAHAAKSDADTSLVLGFCSVVLCWTMIGSFVCGLCGIYLAIRSGKKYESNMSATAIVGLIFNIIGLFITCSIFFPIFY